MSTELLEGEMSSPLLLETEPDMAGGAKADDKGRTGIIIATTGLIVTVVLAVLGGGWALHHEFAGINAHLERLDRRLDKFDTALRILTKSQSGDTKDVIQDILDQAKQFASNGDVKRTQKYLLAATKLTNLQVKQRTPATPQFFQNANGDLAQIHRSATPELKPIVFDVQSQLADYRSSINVPVGMSGATIDCLGSRGAVAIGVPFSPYHTNEISRIIQNGGVRNCNQTLDGLGWINEVFINTNVSYDGGAVLLQNVTFVNCKFQVTFTDPGFRLLQYATLDSKEEFVYKPEEQVGLLLPYAYTLESATH